MGTKNNPGKFDCYQNADPDEPLFILLARDDSAPKLVMDWAMERLRLINEGRKPYEDMEMVAEAIYCAKNMIAWKRARK